MRRLKTRFLIADSRGARWVEWSAEHKGFTTTGALEAPPPHAPHGPHASFPGHGGGQYGADDAPQQREARERFAAHLAETINHEADAGRIERLGMVGPPRLLHEIKARLSHAAAGRLAVEVPKNLAGMRDSELGEWLA